MTIGHYEDSLHQALLKELFGETFKMTDLSTLGGVLHTLITAQDSERLRQAQGRAVALIRAIELLDEVRRKLYRE